VRYQNLLSYLPIPIPPILEVVPEKYLSITSGSMPTASKIWEDL